MTDDAVRVGIHTVEGLDDMASALGFSGFPGTTRGYADAIVNELNEHGGAFGRRIDAVYGKDRYDEQREMQLAALCTRFTQDEPVFAVLLTGPSAPPSYLACLQQAGVVTIVAAEAAGDPATFAASPWYLHVDAPHAHAGAAALAAGLADQSFFLRNSVVGLVHPDDAMWRGTAAVLRGALARRAVDVHHDFAFDTGGSRNDRFAAGSAAVLKFASTGVDHVVFLGNTAGYFMTAAEQQRYKPRYGLSTSSYPQAIAFFGPHSQLPDTYGIGWHITSDVAAREEPPPSKPRRRCEEIMRRRGQPTAERFQQLAIALGYCEVAFFFAEAANRPGTTPTQQGFVAAAEALGRAHEPVATFATRFSAQRHDGAAAYRHLQYDEGCRCFQYTSEPRLFP